MKDDPRLHLAGGEADMKLRRRSEEEQGGGVDGVQEQLRKMVISRWWRWEPI